MIVCLQIPQLVEAPLRWQGADRKLGFKGLLLGVGSPDEGHVLMGLDVGQLVQTDPIPEPGLGGGGRCVLCVAHLKVHVQGVNVLDVVENNLRETL